MFIGCLAIYYIIATILLHAYVHANKVHDYYIIIILYIQVDGVLSKYNWMAII